MEQASAIDPGVWGGLTVAGMRLAVSLGASSVAVWAIGPVVKAAGFTALLGVMAVTSVVTLLVLTQLPRTPAPVPAAAGGSAGPR